MNTLIKFQDILNLHFCPSAIHLYISYFVWKYVSGWVPIKILEAFINNICHTMKNLPGFSLQH